MVNRKLFEVGNPKRVLVYDKKGYKDYIKKNNGVANLYETVYHFKYLKDKYKPDYASAVIDKIFFDFDSENSLINIRKFHNYLLSKNIKHYMVQSSYLKFHCFVFCKKEELNNKKCALFNSQVFLAKENSFSFGNEKWNDLDKSCFGDIARLKAIPLTFKPKRNGWVSYINSNDLNDIDILKGLTQEPRKVKTFYGSDLFSLKEFDNEKLNDYSDCDKIIDLNDYESNFNNEFEKLFPPLIKKILIGKNGYGYWRNRWAFTIFCRDMAFPKNVTDRIAKKYFSKQLRTDKMKNNYEHFIRCKIIDYVYGNANKYIFPSLIEFKNNGFEVTDDDKNFFKKELYK